MKTWNATGIAGGRVDLGEIEAETSDEALRLAFLRASVSLCHRCAQKVSDLEVDTVYVETDAGEYHSSEDP